MSTYSNYKAYKKYEPDYAEWKFKRDRANAMRKEYLRKNPHEIKKEDVQRGQALIRAIDIMDDYSQKRAENMEMATETVVQMILTGFGVLGIAAVPFLKKIKFLDKILAKYCKTQQAKDLTLMYTAMGTATLLPVLPLYNWASSVEIGASRRGRFEAMRKELKNPAVFANLTEDQIKSANINAKTINLEDEKNNSFGKVFKTIKEIGSDTNKYKKQKKIFETELIEDQKHLNDSMTPQETEKAKRDMQILTKLVEKIDIASQDYAENAELATSALTIAIFGMSELFNAVLGKVLNACKVKNAQNIKSITRIATICGYLAIMSSCTQIQKEASRIGRYKAKQELINNPAELVYVPDEKLNEAGVKEANAEPVKKEGIFKFLSHAFKDAKEYKQYKKGRAKEEAKFYKALEKLEISDEQLKDAKRLQKNTFRTFNKVDENSQKYSESVEALGQSLGAPIAYISGVLGALVGVKYLNRALTSPKNKLSMTADLGKYMTAIIFSIIPSVLVNSVITKEQKKASRIADMLAINEMSDYRMFR